MVVRDGVTEERRVEVGPTNDDEAQIIEGITKGDVVSATPSREIDAGMRVTTTLIGASAASAR